MERKVAFIPTQSLFQIEEKCHDKLDHKIHILTGRHRWQISPKVEPLSDYLSFSTSGYRVLFLSFNHDKCESLFSLPKVVEECNKLGAYDLFIENLVLFLPMERGITFGPTYIYFNNVAPTPGKKVEALVKATRKRFLRKHGYELKELRSPRMLEFTIARTLEGHPIDPILTSHDKFLTWLSKQTDGLTMSVPETEKRKTVFRHGDEVELYDSCWKEEVSDIE
mgnify:CR=1 FL=1